MLPGQLIMQVHSELRLIMYVMQNLPELLPDHFPYLFQTLVWHRHPLQGQSNSFPAYVPDMPVSALVSREASRRKILQQQSQERPIYVFHLLTMGGHVFHLLQQ